MPKTLVLAHNRWLVNIAAIIVIITVIAIIVVIIVHHDHHQILKAASQGLDPVTRHVMSGK